MSLRGLLGKINIWTGGRRSQADCPPQCRGASCHPLNRKKGLTGREWALSDYLWAGLSVVSCLWTWPWIEICTIGSPGSQALDLDSTVHHLHCRSSSWVSARLGTSWRLWPCQPIPYKLSPSLFSLVLILQATQRTNAFWLHGKRYFCFWWAPSHGPWLLGVRERDRCWTRAPAWQVRGLGPEGQTRWTGSWHALEGTVSLIPPTMWRAGPMLEGEDTTAYRKPAWPSSGWQASLQGWAKRAFQYSFTGAATPSASRPLRSASGSLALIMEDFWVPLLHGLGIWLCPCDLRLCDAAGYSLPPQWNSRSHDQAMSLDLLVLKYAFSDRGPQGRDILQWEFFCTSHTEILFISWTKEGTCYGKTL